MNRNATCRTWQRPLRTWAELLRQFPDEEDRILPLLAALSGLLSDVEAAFPGARAFIRPGFDTGDSRLV